MEVNEAPKCSAITRSGNPCKGYALLGETTCVSHTPGVGDLAREKAVLASAEKRRQAVERREEAQEDARLTLTQRIRRDTAARAAEVSKALLDAAIADGASAAMRELLNRNEGKVADVQRVDAGDPFQMTQADLEKWLQEADEASSEAQQAE